MAPAYKKGKEKKEGGNEEMKEERKEKIENPVALRFNQSTEREAS